MNKKLLSVAIASALLVTACGSDSDSNNASEPKNVDDTPVVDTPTPVDDSNDDSSTIDLTKGKSLTRLATIPLGSELTGMYATDQGDLFFNIQHPSSSLPGPENKAAVGAWVGVDIQNLDPELELSSVPASSAEEAKTTQVATGSYQAIGREGDTFSGGMPFGLGNIVNADENMEIKQSNDPDFNAFIPTNDDGSEGFLFTAWEDRPGGMSRIQISKNADGTWNPQAAMNINFSDVNGTMINCFGTLSPWGTPLTSEENYMAELTQQWNEVGASGYPSYADVQKIQDYLGGTFPNPYDYGYIVEINQPTAETPTPEKLFTLGRSAHENPVIMPDNKTVYLTDDGGNKGFYKFVADTAGDLSAGTLYAAKVVQDSEVTDSSTAGFNISWIELANANNAQIEQWIREYDGIDESDFVDGQTNYISDTEVEEWALGNATDDRVAFLETLRAAGEKGATVEFNKMEGININYEGLKSGNAPYMYVAMADVNGAMSDSEGDIQITENRCGIVYRFNLDTNYNATRMEPVVAGGPYDSNASENRCSIDGIAQPDNIVVLNDGRVLIGEDSGNHENNMLWVYNPMAN
ncbi:alkaline phosphatase PhoX [Bermanella sp. R86510]|uniref:PhoX family protein n=1 Tax=unclassified Bermanella TaxID=2627862 RepID=UPI0037C75B71